MADRANGKDKALARQEQVRRLAQLPAKQKLDALIDAPNSRELVRAMPAEELYYAIEEVGLADATDIVHLASPSQFRTFVDLGGWKRDRIDPHSVLTWLRAARTDEPEDFQAKWDAVDTEVAEYMLRSFITLHSLEENPDANPPGVTMETPEGKYLIEFHAEGIELSTLRAMMLDLMSRGPFEFVRLLEATRWEVPSELEETAHRFRSARLEDLGFPPLEQAASLFAYLDPDKVHWNRPSPTSGTTQLAPSAGRIAYLDTALRALEPLERENLEQELRALANSALVAEVQDPGDLEAVRRVGEMVRDYLSLGIEHLTGGEPTLAAEVVRDLEARRIFQVGFSLTLKLKFRVDRLAKEPLAMIGETWLVLPEQANVLAALRRRRPLRALKVEGAEPVPFRSRRELDESAREIDAAQAQLALFRALLGGNEVSAKQTLEKFAHPLEILGTERLLAAAIAHAVLDGAVRAEPLPSERLAEFGERLFEGTPDDPKLKADAAERPRTTLTALVPEAAREGALSAVNSGLERLLLELGPAALSGGLLEPSVGEILPISGRAAL